MSSYDGYFVAKWTVIKNIVKNKSCFNKRKSQNKPYGLLWDFGAGVLNGFEKTNYKQPTFTHIFKPYQIGTLVFSKIIN